MTLRQNEGEDTSAFWCRVEREAAKARVQDMTMEDTIKFVALNGMEDSEMRKDVSKLDLDYKLLQEVNELIYLVKKCRHLLHQETSYVKHVSEGGNNPPRAPTRITCYRCRKPHYKSQCTLPRQVCLKQYMAITKPNQRTMSSYQQQAVVVGGKHRQRSTKKPKDMV